MFVHDYKTSDVVLATYLKCKGFKITKIEVEGKKGHFVFEKVERSILQDFNLQSDDAKRFTHFASTMKQLIRSVRRLTDDGFN